VQDEPVHLPPVASIKRRRAEFNRIRDSFIIRVKRPEEVTVPPHVRNTVRCGRQTELNA